MMDALKRPLKLYLDTSVPNFLFAEDAKDKQIITRALFRPEIREQYEFYISVVVVREIERAPVHIIGKLLETVADITILMITKESDALAAAYLEACVLPKSSFEDAQHVAIATINNLDALVSWNFRHLVNLRRAKLVNLVNERMGYKHIEIVSPQEVVNP